VAPSSVDGVCQNAANAGATCGANAGDSLIELRLVAPGYDHLGALDGQPACDLKADTGGRAGDKGYLVVQLQVHYENSHDWMTPKDATGRQAFSGGCAGQACHAGRSPVDDPPVDDRTTATVGSNKPGNVVFSSEPHTLFALRNHEWSRPNAAPGRGTKPPAGGEN
jgi:hypothetical protein